MPLADTLALLEKNIARIIRGKEQVIRKTLLCLISEGHLLLEDVPGTGKTRLAQALTKSLKLAYRRIQFTPDMLPGDITGSSRFDTVRNEFVFMPGPVFTNVILADEINRGTPRVQSALLECMAERTVTVDGQRYRIENPFFVIATQNPIEFTGTYPLPEAQLDRFLMRLQMGYPTPEAERELLADQAANDPMDQLTPVAQLEDLQKARDEIRTIQVSEQVRDYITAIMSATREHPALRYGCSPRAALALMRISQANAAAEKRNFVLPRDVRDLAIDVLPHRIPLQYSSRSQYGSSTAVLQEILETLPLSRWEK